jgi:hypothetical protein
MEHTRERSPERVVGWAFGEKSFREREMGWLHKRF